ncbi:hypothetical protein PYW08_016960 [Mythimna loreyi]|nr:hypothetical protein PYW08_016960 [Mythimna loreyi]
MRPFRCVKCGQSHKTSDCHKRDRNTPALCALCNGPHPANYKGCEVYREILARKNNKNKNTLNAKRQLADTENTKSKPNINPLKHDQQLSYAEAVKQAPQNNCSTQSLTNDHPGQTIQSLEDVLIKNNEKFDLILQQMSILMSLIAKLVDKLT